MNKTLGLLLVAGACCMSLPSGAESDAAPTDVSDLARLSDTRHKFFADAMSGLSAAQLETFWSVYGE